MKSRCLHWNEFLSLKSITGDHCSDNIDESGNLLRNYPYQNGIA
ncbi:hypothetical protein [Xylanibacter muris]|nr:hypothetical protein [Xylanibacter muris]